MLSFAFRDPRIETNLTVRLRLQEISTEHLHPGSVNATIVNISKSGACLLIEQLLINGKHLFFTTLNSTHIMTLQSTDNTEKIKKFNVSAQSIWMDSLKRDNHLYFKVGIRFTTPQKKLFQNVKGGSV